MPRGASAPLEGETTSSLAHTLGIEEGDLDQLGEFFAEMAAPLGIDGRRAFAKLRKGAAFGKALGITPKAVEFLYFRACKWFQAGCPEKAEPIFRALCILEAERADFWAGLGVCLRTRGAWDDALAAFDKAAQTRPGWVVPCFHKLEIFVRQQAWAKAAWEMAQMEAIKAPDVPRQFAIEAEKYKKAIEAHRSRLPSGREKP